MNAFNFKFAKFNEHSCVTLAVLSMQVLTIEIQHFYGSNQREFNTRWQLRLRQIIWYQNIFTKILLRGKYMFEKAVTECLHT